MKHKTWAALMTAAAILGASFTTLAEAPYTDLNTLQSRDAVDYLYDIHCLSFVTGSQFLPNQLMTRSDLAQLIYQAAASMPPVSQSFTDVKAGSAADAIAAVSAEGILSGYADGSFQPDQIVSREEFADVIYRYLQYCHTVDIAQPNATLSPYVDANRISAAYKKAVDALYAKRIMVPADNRFRPQEGITRADATDVMYHILHSDAAYVSHVQIETQVIKIINAEYGSTAAFMQQGTIYWDGDTLVLGFKGNPSKSMKKRLQEEVSRPDAVSLRRVHFSRMDYTQLMMRAVNAIVGTDGVQNYIGAIPDYAHEQIVVTVRHPLSEAAREEVAKRVGEGIVRFETAEASGQIGSQKENSSKNASTTVKATDHGITDEGKVRYSPLIDQAASDMITSVQQDVIH